MRKTISVTIITVLALLSTTVVVFAGGHDRSNATGSDNRIYQVATPTDEVPPPGSGWTPEPPEAGIHYNRGKAAIYANTWAHGRNSAYPNYGSQCGCDSDCTNYVSQILHEGGMPLDPANSGNWWPYNNAQWWYGYYCMPWGCVENSNTWSATDWLRDYANNYPAKFQYRTSPVSPGNLSKGDFFLMDLDYDNIPDHARIIVGGGYTSTNQADYTMDGCTQNGTYPIPARKWALLVNQHCVDRWHVAWNYRVASGIRKWSYHVIW
jgi:hypothetical protein